MPCPENMIDEILMREENEVQWLNQCMSQSVQSSKFKCLSRVLIRSDCVDRLPASCYHTGSDLLSLGEDLKVCTYNQLLGNSY